MTAQRDDYFKILFQISQDINSSLDLNKVLNSTMDQVIRLMQAERGFIMLLKEGELEFVAGRNLDQQTVEGGKDYSRSVVDRVVRDGTVILTLDAMSDQRFNVQASVITMGLRSVLCVPLKVKDRMIGVIYVDNRARSGIFTQHQSDMLVAFANNVAISIENARLYEDLQRSIEERLRLQEEIHREATKAAVLREATRMREELAHYLVHDLRNPLTVIIGSLSHVKPKADEFLEEDELMLFNDAQNFSQTLLNMVNAILDVYRLESGHIKLNFQSCDIKRIAEDVVHASQGLVEEGVALTAELPAENLIIKADPNMVRRTLANLVNNACRFTYRGGITVRAFMGEEDVRIEVQDSGPGIPEEYHRKIFDKFGQVEASKSGNRASTGLGLTFCQLAVEAHGGKIWVNSEVGKGSTFVFLLPINRAPDQDQTPPQQAEAKDWG